MISVKEALELVLSQSQSAESEVVMLEEAYGRVLAQPILADRDFPPYDRVTMDGIAVRYESIQKGISRFEILSTQGAGETPHRINEPTQCIEVMTGAVLPIDSDTVIRYEDLEIDANHAKLKVDHVRKGQNVHAQGSDRKAKSELIAPSKRLEGPELSILASCGYEKVQAFKLPKVAIISSGDELVRVSEQPLPHQIRRSNNYSVFGALQALNISANYFHLNDDLSIIVLELQRILEEYDMVILSGGVSMGKYDYIPQALDKLGVQQLFHKVAQRPGKPFWFGITEEKKPIFALPGNPVSTFMCTQQYIIPYLKKHLNLEVRPQYAELGSDIKFKPDLHYYAQVRLDHEVTGKCVAHPIEGNGSGDFVNLTEADAFVELPRGKDFYRKGEVYRILPFRQM